MKLIQNIGAKLYNPLAPIWFDKSMFDYLPKEGIVLNLGSGNTRLENKKAINLDIHPFPNVDVVADAHAIPFPDNYFDGLLCNAVLEHTKQPWIVAKEIERVLKIGGIACVQVPFLEGVHDNEDYFRFTLKGLKSLFPEFDEIKSGVSGSSWQILAELVMMHPVMVLENTPFWKPGKLLMSWFAIPIQRLDFMVRNSVSMAKYARAYYFVGRKR